MSPRRCRGALALIASLRPPLDLFFDKVLVNAPDADAKSRILFAYFAGLLTQARIQNDLRVLDEAPDGLLSLLGAAAPPAAVAA